MADDDFFADDDLDDIPVNTLHQLEQQAYSTQQQAFHSTQQHAFHSAQQHTQPQAHGVKNLPWRPPQSTVGRPQSTVGRPHPTHRLPTAPPPSAPRPPSSDYGFEDEHVVDLAEPPAAVQPAPHIPPPSPPPPSAAPRPVQRAGGKAARHLDPETAAAFAAADQELGGQAVGRWPQPDVPAFSRAPLPPPVDVAAFSRAPSPPSVDVAAMHARIAELEAEQVRLRLSAQRAREDARAKQGEIAIVRSNQERAAKQYEARISAMQRLHADEAAQANAQLAAQRKECEQMQTDHRFLQHDLAQEAERAKRLPAPSGTTSAPRETPQKVKRAALGDGFDERERRWTATPSTSRQRPGADQTPRAGAKRKRPAPDSPVQSLGLARPPQHPGRETAASGPPEPLAARADTRYEFMQLVLNHFPHAGHDATLESLARYSFPAQPSKTLAALFIHHLSAPSTDESLPITVARACLALWSRCLAERFFAAFYLILDLLRFALQYQLSSAKSQLLEQAIPICSKTIDLIAIPTWRASTNRKFAASLDTKALEDLADEIDVERVLEFLQDLCNAASLSTERNEVFWKTVGAQFVLIMLNKAQPLSQITTLLHMLRTSARESTFGAIAHDAVKQPEQERGTIDRLTNLLFEAFQPPQDEDPYGSDEILQLRIHVLAVFRQMCGSEHGGRLLTQNRNAIGRLVRFLDAHVRRLYHARAVPGVSGEGRNAESATHALLAQCINVTVRLIYHLLRACGDEWDLVPKLHAVHGGYHKFLVSMTRVAFTEQLVFEAGIEDEAAEAAHRILDAILGPEDGDAVMEAIETPRATTSATENATTRGPHRTRPDGPTDDDDTTMGEPG